MNFHTLGLFTSVALMLAACASPAESSATTAGSDLVSSSAAQSFDCTGGIRIVADPAVSNGGFVSDPERLGAIPVDARESGGMLVGRLDGAGLSHPPTVISLDVATGQASYLSFVGGSGCDTSADDCGGLPPVTTPLTCTADHATSARTFDCTKLAGESGPTSVRVVVDAKSGAGFASDDENLGQRPLDATSTGTRLTMRLDGAGLSSPPTVVSLDTTTGAADYMYSFGGSGCDTSADDCGGPPPGVSKLSCHEVK